MLVDLLIGDCPTAQVSGQLISRYERYVACAREPRLRVLQRRLHAQRAAAVAEAVSRSGRTVRGERLNALVGAIDGAVVTALVEDEENPRATARAVLMDVIDVLAPTDGREMWPNQR